MTAIRLRLVKVNGVYFKYPLDVSLNDTNFLLALLNESNQAIPNMVYIVKKDAQTAGFQFQLAQN
ncbi:MAG: hypothetical protein LBR56_07365 [Sporomusaceae bacterium]|jgi:hypothetical protein|nr:hypothetical protein [Sporomusaceae bacterium]